MILFPLFADETNGHSQIRFSYGLEHQVYRVLSGSAIIYSWRAAVMTACLVRAFSCEGEFLGNLVTKVV